jgi:predicted Zn-dependent protease
MFRRAIDTRRRSGPRLSLASLVSWPRTNPAKPRTSCANRKKTSPSNSVGYRMLGDFYYANNQLDKATDEYAAYIKDHPKDMVVKKNYIQLLILKDRTRRSPQAE